MSRRIQVIRNTLQLIFLGLLLLGLYMKFKVVFIALLPLSLLTGNFFCGWLCPYGAAQEFFGALGKRIFKRKYRMPEDIQNYLQYSRYILAILALAGLGTIFLEDVNSYKVFMTAGTDLSTIVVSLSVVVMIGFLFISMLFERPFCNYLCIEATKYGIASLTRVFTIKRRKDSCINCKRCNGACPMNISISHVDSVRNAQCINCFECITACPKRDTLSYGRVKGRKE
ncbi:hypothetical protein PM10SUCC1_08480 [Propionigenium maris DSM 9537]|uniref:4Fe-4S ferredoxin-type domain-containing protein n=1 Tax=Propionigenium maris DSM 9537 TaxID=1123000 RepID=A0A9W6GK31_9FUSO|nr:4Fe-4S binding protein [Propionigenium maris]GLI55334.1 hypothetical protein PM10SUCC1_08480 [Propionigenium maris DSM 9537]